MGSTKWGGRRKWDRPNARDEIGNYEIGCDQFVAHAPERIAEGFEIVPSAVFE